MFKLGYCATSDDLFLCPSKAIKIDRNSGMPENAFKAKVDIGIIRAPARYITVRPGLTEGLAFYGAITDDTGTLVCLSDRHQTRYYWFGITNRETIIVDSPSQSFTQAIANLFEGLVKDERASHIKFYLSVIKSIVIPYFIGQGEKLSFTVDGFCKQAGEEYIATLEWATHAPNDVLVSSTLDPKRSRKVSLLSHPIAEVHKQCLR